MIEIGKKYYAKIKKSKAAPIIERGLKNLDKEVIIQAYSPCYGDNIFVRIEGIDGGWFVERFYNITPFYGQLFLNF